MTSIKAVITMLVTVLCASLLLLGNGFERVGQVALSIYALLMCLVLLADQSQSAKVPVTPLPVKYLARICFLYVVVVSAYTGHMVIAFVLALTWIIAWAQRVLRQAERDKQLAE